MQASSGEEKCVCVRQGGRRYNLECGFCVDPCAMKFVPTQTFSGGNRRNSNNGFAAAGSHQRPEDLKKLLLDEFLKEVVNK